MGLDKSTQISQNPDKVITDDLQMTFLMLLFGFDPKTFVGWAVGKNEEREGLAARALHKTRLGCGPPYKPIQRVT